MNGIMDLHHPLLQALGFAVLHSIWQGVLLFCILKTVLAFVPHHHAKIRYRLQYSTLTILFVLFAYTFISGWQHATGVDSNTGLAVPHAGKAGIAGISWQQFLSLFHLSAYSRYIPLLAVVYTSGLAVLCSKMIWELLQVRYLRRQVILPEHPLLEQFGLLKAQVGIRRNVWLRLSDKVQVPVMLGYLKPLILLPVSLASRLDMQQTEAILLHELAHIRRNDYCWNILQMVLETLLFFNPVVWWLSAAIREEREHCCDDYVLQHTGQSLPYARALLALEECRSAAYAPLLSAAGRRKTPLLNRIKRFTTMTQHKKNTQRTLAAVTALVLLGAMVCFATAFGQDKKDKPVQKTSHKAYSKSVVSVTDDDGHTRTYTKVKGDTAGMAEAMAAVPQAMKLAGDAMKEIDWDEIGKTVTEATSQAMASVNWDEIHSSVHQAMKGVDWDEVNSSVSTAMKEAGQAMKEVHMEDYMDAARKEMAKAMKEMQLEMKNMNTDEIRRSMEEAKEQLKQVKEEMKHDLKQAKEDMKRAKNDSKRAAQEAQEAREVSEDVAD